MSSTGNTSPTSTILKALGDQLLGNIEGNAAALVRAFLTNVKANPTTQNVMAQGAILQVSALLQLPNLEQSAITELADAGLAALDTLKPAT